MKMSVQVVTVLLLAFGSAPSSAARSPANGIESRAEFISEVKIAQRYFIVDSDVTYRTANGISLKLDIYTPSGVDDPRPTLVYFHGGGWMEPYTKATFPLFFAPFLGMAWNVINVDYRPSSVSLAPAAVEDCLCAMRWIVRHATKYRVDVGRLVTMGNSAGGHLALTSAFIPLSESGYGGPCSHEDAGASATMASVKVAAVVNWSGITDVADLIDGVNRKNYAVIWIGNPRDRLELARSVSPLTHVRPDSPPVISIHGDKDEGVPYSQALRLHAELTSAGVRNKLVTIRGGGHGFDLSQTTYAYESVFKFLDEIGLFTKPRNDEMK